MRQQDAPARIARRALDGKKGIQFADKILQRPHIRPALRIQKAHTQRDLIVAQSLSDKSGALFLARCQSLAAQLFEQIIKDFRVDKRFATAYYRRRDAFQVGRPKRA